MCAQRRCGLSSPPQPRISWRGQRLPPGSVSRCRVGVRARIRARACSADGSAIAASATECSAAMRRCAPCAQRDPRTPATSRAAALEHRRGSSPPSPLQPRRRRCDGGPRRSAGRGSRSEAMGEIPPNAHAPPIASAAAARPAAAAIADPAPGAAVAVCRQAALRSVPLVVARGAGAVRWVWCVGRGVNGAISSASCASRSAGRWSARCGCAPYSSAAENSLNSSSSSSGSSSKQQQTATTTPA